MSSEKRIISILFADIQKYSSIENDELYLKLENIIEEFKKDILSTNNHFFHKPMGDDLFICSNDPVDIANIALDFRDKFKNFHWRREGFPFELAIRIGIHLEKVNITYDEKGKVKNVIGKNVNATARIEPIVEPNHIYCSKFFKEHIDNEEDLKFAFKKLGIRQLAKNFGEMELYELLRDYEISQTENIQQIVVPQFKLKKNITDKDLDDYITDAYNVVYQYFNKALSKISEENPQIKITLNKIDEITFSCNIYINGNLETQWKIWLNTDYSRRGIYYSENISFDKNSYNGWINVKHENGEIFFEPLMDFSSNDKKLKSPEEVAEYLWEKFIETIN